jgi:hypothetical protein
VDVRYTGRAPAAVTLATRTSADDGGGEDRCWPSPSSEISTWCEILPLVFHEDRVLLMRPSTRPSWWVAQRLRLDPSQIVTEELALHLDPLFDPATSIVHSTSWRYEARHGALVLTYVVILQPAIPPAGPSVSPPPGFALEPVEIFPGATHVRSTPLELDIADVLAHGLRHFALLRNTDPSIAAALSPSWHALLRRLDPLPAGSLHLS